jgi:hypothetical protein
MQPPIAAFSMLLDHTAAETSGDNALSMTMGMDCDEGR